jgi:tetratricopeptide (TPR) repeat protein
MDIRVQPDAGPAKFLLHETSIAQGEEICAVARLGKDDGALPKSVTVLGTLDGEAFHVPLDLPARMSEAGHLPRTWAKLELDRLIAEDVQQKNRDKIIELSKQMYVMTPYTSLLVLENEEMYERFKVDRGRKDHWAHYQTPPKIEVKFEPLDGQPLDARFAPKTQKPHANQVLQTILVRLPASILTWPNRSNRFGNQPVTAALHIYHGAFAKPLGGERDQGWVNEEIGNDPDLPTNFNIDRLEEVIMAGERGEQLRKLNKDGESLLMGMMNGRNAGPGRVPRGLRSETMEWRGGLGGPRRADSWGRLPERDRLARADEQILALREREGRPEWMKTPPPEAGYFDRPVRAGYFARTVRLATTEAFDMEKADKAFKQTARESADGPPMYGRPGFSQQDRVFYDLISYLPGLNTSQADIDAILDAEAMPKLSTIPGTIDPAARPLIDKARSAGWQQLKLGEPGASATGVILFDGQGRYAYERTTPMGLREEVVCDGRTILHLYPELGVGARRQVSRAHRAEFAQLVPWVLPPIEDLARGFDVKKIGDRTIALIPRGAQTPSPGDRAGVATHLTFAADGRLIERRIVENVIEDNQPQVKVLFAETYENGVVKLVNREGKELSKRELKLAPAQAPSQTRDVSKLVVLPMPWRTREQAYEALGIDPHMLLNPNENWTFSYLDADTALGLMATEFASQDARRLRQLHRLCFVNHGSNKLGFYTLLVSLNYPVASDAEFRELMAAQPDEPLVRFLALAGNPVYRSLQARWSLDLGATIGPKDHFLTRLASFRDLYLNNVFLANTNAPLSQLRAAFQKGMEFVQHNRTSVLGWAMLTVLADRANHPELHKQVAHAWRQFADEPALGYVAQYEHARGLLHAKQPAEAGRLFRELYEKMLQAKLLPPIDGDFRSALLQERGGTDRWSELMQKTAQSLLQEKHRVAVVALAWQCWQLGDAPLAENLLATALANPANEAERLGVTAAAVDYLLASSQVVRADDLIKPLLDDPQAAKRAGLWRLAATIAQRRGQTARSITCLENALQIEFQSLPDVVNLQQVRDDYGRLLAHYESLADAVASLQISPPPDLAARTIRAADRWRALDRDNGSVCDTAARILKTLGARELAWDYLTTPIGMRPNEAGPWHGLAVRLSHNGEHGLADLAYQAAFAAEPTDAQLLWERAMNLRRAGKRAEANTVLAQVRDGDWQPRFNALKSQARWQLEGR